SMGGHGLANRVLGHVVPHLGTDQTASAGDHRVPAFRRDSSVLAFARILQAVAMASDSLRDDTRVGSAGQVITTVDSSISSTLSESELILPEARMIVLGMEIGSFPSG